MASSLQILNLRYVKERLDQFEHNVIQLHDGYKLGPGSYVRWIWSGHILRRYVIYVSTNYKYGKSVPLVVNLHGGGGRAETARLQSLMDGYADSRGYLVAYPDGIGYVIYAHRLLHWYPGPEYNSFFRKDIDDVAHFQALIKDIQQFFDISKVFVVGLSNGSMMAYRLACDIPNKLAAIACLSGTMLKEENNPSEPVPILHIHGLADKNAPYDGGPGQYSWIPIDHRSVAENISIWINNNRCNDTPTTVIRNNATIMTYTPNTPTGAAVRLIKVPDLGHGWPGGTRMLSSYIEGDIDDNINACVEIFKFFEEFGK